jgi:hypothetical protein
MFHPTDKVNTITDYRILTFCCIDLFTFTLITIFNATLCFLSKDLEYNLHHKRNNWLKTLAIEADTAINQLNPTD